MKLEITKIRLGELEAFVESTTFKQFTTIPISNLRAKSYLANPNARPGDVVLILGFIGDQLVAFRSLFAGRVQTGAETIRFAWCSGNWVHPGHRRKGFSERLLEEALSAWNGKLMFTNYAPNSENLYIKSGKFKPVHHFHGFRGYLFPKTMKLLMGANKNRFSKFTFSLIDGFIAGISQARLLFYNPQSSLKVRFETLEFPDQDCLQLMDSVKTGYTFARGKQELLWIFGFPWISGKKSDDSEKYPFSVYTNRFFYKTVKVFSENSFEGFFIFSVRDGHLKTLFFILPENLNAEIAHFLKQFCANHKIEVITVYNNRISGQLLARKFPFLHTKKYGQKIYGSFEIKSNKNLLFQDGDGDVFFT